MLKMQSLDLSNASNSYLDIKDIKDYVKAFQEFFNENLGSAQPPQIRYKNVNIEIKPNVIVMPTGAFTCAGKIFNPLEVAISDETRGILDNIRIIHANVDLYVVIARIRYSDSNSRYPDLKEYVEIVKDFFIENHTRGETLQMRHKGVEVEVEFNFIVQLSEEVILIKKELAPLVNNGEMCWYPNKVRTTQFEIDLHVYLGWGPYLDLEYKQNNNVNLLELSTMTGEY